MPPRISNRAKAPLRMRLIVKIKWRFFSSSRLFLPNISRQGGLTVRADLGWLTHGVNEHVHLLAHKDGKVVAVKAVDDLQNASINALGGVAGERLFGDNVRLEAHKPERRLNVFVTAQVGGCG